MKTVYLTVERRQVVVRQKIHEIKRLQHMSSLFIRIVGTKGVILFVVSLNGLRVIHAAPGQIELIKLA